MLTKNRQYCAWRKSEQWLIAHEAPSGFVGGAGQRWCEAWTKIVMLMYTASLPLTLSNRTFIYSQQY